MSRKLTIELVPASSWGDNLRSRLYSGDWDRLRKACYGEALFRCEICGGRGRKHPVECHEIWSYDDMNGIQKLERLIALCPSCHEVKHVGLAEIRGRLDAALRHMAKTNGTTLAVCRDELSRAAETWVRRSERDWTLDLSWLIGQGIHTLEEPVIV